MGTWDGSWVPALGMEHPGPPVLISKAGEVSPRGQTLRGYHPSLKLVLITAGAPERK